MRDHTIDEALVELARTMKALKALRAERKARKAEDLATMYVAPKGNRDITPEQVQVALNAPYRGWHRRSALGAAARRASLDLTRKLADLRAGR